MLSGFLAVLNECFLRRKMHIPFDRKAELTANAYQLGKAHKTQFGIPQTEVTQAEGNQGLVWVKLGEEPDAPRIGSISLTVGL